MPVTMEQYEEQIIRSAKIIATMRKTESLSEEFKRRLRDVAIIPSSQQEMDSDWRIACAFVGSSVLFEDGSNFDDLSTECYAQLEQTWLHEIKKLRAYFVWFEGSKMHVRPVSEGSISRGDGNHDFGLCQISGNRK